MNYKESTQIIPVVIGALGTVTYSLEENLKKLQLKKTTVDHCRPDYQENTEQSTDRYNEDRQNYPQHVAVYVTYLPEGAKAWSNLIFGGTVKHIHSALD